MNKQLTTRFQFLCTVLCLVFVSFACTPQAQPAPTSQPPQLPSSKNGLIAFLDGQGNLNTVDEFGQNRIAITQDSRPVGEDNIRVYTDPTWSFDGRHLAFISYEARASQSISRLLVADPLTAEITELFTSETQAPFYLYWAPENERISFLSTGDNPIELSLHLAYLRGKDARVIDTGQPYYWVWAPDGSEIFIHEGGSSANNPEARLTLLSLEKNEARLVLENPGNFQAPAWSPDGDHLLAAISGESQSELTLLDKNGETIQKLADFESTLAFSFSPNGEHVAYLASSSRANRRTGKLSIISTKSPEILHAPEEDTTIAYFWAPDSQKIAYISYQVPSDSHEQISYRFQHKHTFDLKVLDINTGKIQFLTNFHPTNDFLSILTYFDQYHHSGTIWSPDSTKLVYTTKTDSGGASVWVVDANGESYPIRVADGTLAFWSWK